MTKQEIIDKTNAFLVDEYEQNLVWFTVMC